MPGGFKKIKNYMKTFTELSNENLNEAKNINLKIDKFSFSLEGAKEPFLKFLAKAIVEAIYEYKASDLDFMLKDFKNIEFTIKLEK